MLRPGTIQCILCNGIILHCGGEDRRIVDHLRIEHGVSFNLRYIVAGCMMEEHERNVIADLVQERENIFRRSAINLKKEEVEMKPKIEYIVSNSLVDLHNLHLKKVRLSNIEVHANVFENEVLSSINCPHCNFFFVSWKSLKVHLIAFHKHDTRKNQGQLVPPLHVMKCKICNYSGRNKKQLRNHHRREHTFKSSPCPSSGKTLNLKITRIASSKSVHGKNTSSEKPKSKCCICGLSLSSPGNLKRHIKIMHKEATSLKDGPATRHIDVKSKDLTMVGRQLRTRCIVHDNDNVSINESDSAPNVAADQSANNDTWTCQKGEISSSNEKHQTSNITVQYSTELNNNNFQCKHQRDNFNKIKFLEALGLMPIRKDEHIEGVDIGSASNKRLEFKCGVCDFVCYMDKELYAQKISAHSSQTCSGQNNLLFPVNDVASDLCEGKRQVVPVVSNFCKSKHTLPAIKDQSLVDKTKMSRDTIPISYSDVNLD